MDEKIEELLVEGQIKLDEEARIIEAAEKAEAEEVKNRKLDAINKFYDYVNAEMPALLPYMIIGETFENINDWFDNFSVNVVIPEFSKIVMYFKFRNGIEFLNACWQYVTMFRPDEEEMGFEVFDYCQPGWSSKGVKVTKDLTVLLAHAKEEWEKWIKLYREWEVKKAELNANNEKKRQQSESSKFEMRLTCSRQERVLLDALSVFMNWLDQDAE